MKKIVATLCFLSLAISAHAKCPSDAMTTAAKNLNLTGKVKISAGGETAVDQVTTLGIRTKTYQQFKDHVESQGKDIISELFVFINEESVGAVVQDTKSCALSFFGTDGEKVSDSKISELLPQSITFKLVDLGTTVQISNATATK